MEKSDIPFGWYPKKLNIIDGNIRIQTLSDIELKIQNVLSYRNIENGWIHSGSNRVFNLPKTHKIHQENPCNEDNLKFLVWSLSYFLGMRLTTEIMGFLDATPTKPYELTDFIVAHNEIPAALDIADEFFHRHQSSSICSKLWIAALHTIFLAQNPRLLQFERFMYQYSAIDACFALSKNIKPFSEKNISHSDRIHLMCERYGMETPEWGRKEIVGIRNNLIHECLYIEEPIGFKNYRTPSAENLNLEIQNLVCRLLAAILGNETYSKIPVGIYQTVGWF